MRVEAVSFSILTAASLMCMSSSHQTEARPFLQALAIFALIGACLWLPLVVAQSRQMGLQQQSEVGW